METLVNELIKYFLDEKDHPKIEMPSSYVNKRELLRGLINVRPATYLDEEIIKKEDMLLQSIFITIQQLIKQPVHFFSLIRFKGNAAAAFFKYSEGSSSSES